MSNEFRGEGNLGVQPTLSVWRPGEEPLPPKPWGGKGRPTSLMRRSPEHHRPDFH